MKSLPINTDSFGFIQREKGPNGKTIKNRCGRDFLYYCLHYYYPKLHNADFGNAAEIEKNKIFGLKLPSFLIWTMLSFYKVPQYFRSLGLEIYVNHRRLNNALDLILSLIPIRRISFKDGMEVIENSIDKGVACGIDISINLGGLVDHVMFVWGYDDDNLYVFDSHKVRSLNYEKITSLEDNRFIMRLPKSEIAKRWSIFNRVWVVASNSLSLARSEKSY